MLEIVFYIENKLCPNFNKLKNLYILYTLLVCLFFLFVFLYPINVKTVQPIGPNLFLEPHVTPETVYGWSNFQKISSNKIRFLNIFKIPKSIKSAKFLFCFCYAMYTKRKCSQLKSKMGVLKKYLYILLVCLSVWLYLINFKTAELFAPKFCVSTHMPHGRFKDGKSWLIFSYKYD